MKMIFLDVSRLNWELTILKPLQKYRGQITNSRVYELPGNIAAFLKKEDLARGPAKGRPYMNLTGDPALDPENYTGEPKIKTHKEIAKQIETQTDYHGMENLVGVESGSYVIKWDGHKIVSVGKKMGSKKKKPEIVEV